LDLKFYTYSEPKSTSPVKNHLENKFSSCRESSKVPSGRVIRYHTRNFKVVRVVGRRKPLSNVTNLGGERRFWRACTKTLIYCFRVSWSQPIKIYKLYIFFIQWSSFLLKFIICSIYFEIYNISWTNKIYIYIHKRKSTQTPTEQKLYSFPLLRVHIYVGN